MFLSNGSEYICWSMLLAPFKNLHKRNARYKKPSIWTLKDVLSITLEQKLKDVLWLKQVPMRMLYFFIWLSVACKKYRKMEAYMNYCVLFQYEVFHMTWLYFVIALSKCIFSEIYISFSSFLIVNHEIWKNRTLRTHFYIHHAMYEMTFLFSLYFFIQKFMSSRIKVNNTLKIKFINLQLRPLSRKRSASNRIRNHILLNYWETILEG
jgi:hypothetical protein